MARFALIEMFDSVSDTIPTHVTAKAGYVAGNFPTWNEQWFKDIQAKYALSMAVQADEDADLLDIETGDATDAQAPGWLARKKSNGEKGDLYRQASAVMGLIHTLDAAGFKFGVDYYVVTAHYTGVPHICGPQCGFGIDRQMHGTQWTDHADGRNLDESLVSTEIFNLSRHPEYAILDSELRKLRGASLKRISERGRVMTYDRMQPGYDRKFVENDCLLLFNRLWDVVHEHGKLEPGSAKAKHNWTLDNRGERGRILWAAAHGTR